MPKLVSYSLAIFIALLLVPTTTNAQQDPPNIQCCQWEYNTGVTLGWATSTVHEGECPLVNPQVMNEWIRLLYMAANGVEGGNALCSARNPAWPGWFNMQGDMYRLADQARASFGGTPSGATPIPDFCRSSFFKLNGTLGGWSSPLGAMTADTSLDRTTAPGIGNCDSMYFGLGFRLGYAHQRLQAGDRDAATKQIVAAIQYLDGLESFKPWSGYCVQIWRYMPRLKLLLDRNQLSTPNAVGAIWNLMQEIGSTLTIGDANSSIDSCPGTPAVLSDHGRQVLNGTSRGRTMLASPPTVTAPPIAPPPLTPPGAPTPATPPPPPKAAGNVNLTGTWVNTANNQHVSVFSGGGNRYDVTGTAPVNAKNQGVVVGDGIKFEGQFSDVPGFCCERDGYVWLEVIDENTYRVRSVWWTPGKGSKEKPHLNYGWSTWKRQGR